MLKGGWTAYYAKDALQGSRSYASALSLPDEICVRLVKLQQRLAHRILRVIQRRQVEIERARKRRTLFLPFAQQLLDHIGHAQRAEDGRIGPPLQHR